MANEHKSWPEDSVPCADYLERMRLRGPRPGESRYSFEGRYAAILCHRKMLIEAHRRHRKVRNIGELMAQDLGVRQDNLPTILKTNGLSMQILAEINS